MLSGIFALTALVGGFGLLAVHRFPFDGWLIVKILCWLGLAGVSGMVFRFQEKKPAMLFICGLLTLIALIMVIFKPF